LLFEFAFSRINSAVEGWKVGMDRGRLTMDDGESRWLTGDGGRETGEDWKGGRMDGGNVEKTFERWNVRTFERFYLRGKG
jgi:hypothetical protein